MSSSVSFNRYDDEFQSLTNQVKTSLKDQNVEFSASLLSQCEDLLKQMSVEARGVDDASVKKNLLQKVRQCKSKLSSLKDDFKSLEAQLDRAALSLDETHPQNITASKQRLLAAEQSLDKQNESLDRARRIMADTEQVGMEITSELGRNRETLETAHGRVREVSGLTNRARRLLQNMNRRAVQQKLAMYIMAAVICIVLAIILWNLR